MKRFSGFKQKNDNIEDQQGNIEDQQARRTDRLPQAVTRKSTMTDVKPQSQGGTGKQTRYGSAMPKKTDKEYEPQTQTRGYKGSEDTDSIPQTEMQKMNLDKLEGELYSIMDNEYMEAKERGDKSEIARYESQINKLEKEIEKRKKA